MPNPTTTQVYYSTDGTNFTEFPVPYISSDREGGTTEEIDRGHQNPTSYLQITSPGDRSCGGVVFNFEYNSRTTTHVDFLQLAEATWWLAQTNPLYWRIAWPKTTGHTTPPRTSASGYINRQPVPTNPESGRMTLALSFKDTSDHTNSDGAV